MKHQIKIIRKPTPVKSAVLWVSLTANIFAGCFAYAIVTGKLLRANETQEVALYSGDYVSTLANGK